VTPLAEKIVALAVTPGVKNKEIAAILGINSGTVSGTLNRAGISLNGRNGTKFLNPPRKSTHRPCICCGTGFWSQGPHNRMCRRCRERPME
jgi:hypothetical protein